MLTNLLLHRSGYGRFDEHLLRFVAELVRGTFQRGSARRDGFAEGEVADQVAGQAFDVVDDDHPLPGVGFSIEQVENGVPSSPAGGARSTSTPMFR